MASHADALEEEAGAGVNLTGVAGAAAPLAKNKTLVAKGTNFARQATATQEPTPRSPPSTNAIALRDPALHWSPGSSIHGGIPAVPRHPR